MREDKKEFLTQEELETKTKSETVKKVQKIYDDMEHEINTHYKENYPFPSATPYPCKKGCYFCCSDGFEITESEAVILLNEVYKLPFEKKKHVYEVAKGGVVEIGEKGSEEYRLLSKPCPLISINIKGPSDFSCLAYKSRPLICRAHGVSIYKISDDICSKIENLSVLKSYAPNVMDYFIQLRDLTKNEEKKMLVEWLYEHLSKNPEMIDYDNNLWLQYNSQKRRKKSIFTFLQKINLFKKR